MNKPTLNRLSIPVLYSEHSLTKLCLSNNKIFGLLARGMPKTIDTSTIDIGNLKGQYGESVIGSILNILALETEGLYVFHSVANANGKMGETDHVVLYKNKIILVETKTYNNFKVFKINKQGELKGRKIDQPKSLRKLDNNNLIEKVDLYSQMFPNYSVHAITAITRAGIETYSENGKYKVASLENLSINVNYHLNQAVKIDEDLFKETVYRLAAYCLKK